MTTKTIKLIFDTTPKNGALLFNEYEDKVINTIKTDERLGFDIFIKNPMPITEFDGIVRELCDKIKVIFNCKSKSSHNDECIIHGSNSLISSITYYIEITFYEI